ncbi:hypothetical protein DERP_013685 [Dermatophagoides pteronyssinus]|uniref:CRIB domain-containing protein n=1 Tax=Dermatophagoides pteronyssinus TaxID=6956 RepID=A0ABQ8JV79_DERPT|nr:hypothetical protein DERP_013685 [Dermatophagoides pteronyssinus]
MKVIYDTYRRHRHNSSNNKNNANNNNNNNNNNLEICHPNQSLMMLNNGNGNYHQQHESTSSNVDHQMIGGNRQQQCYRHIISIDSLVINKELGIDNDNMDATSNNNGIIHSPHGQRKHHHNHHQQHQRLCPEMISRPQGDLKHTGHVGADGIFFGDVSFLDGKYHHVQQQPSSKSNGILNNNDILDFGPSLMEEVFRELDHIKPDLNNDAGDCETAINENSINVKNEVRELNLKMCKESNQMKKNKSNVKPISEAEQNELDSAIAMAKDIANRVGCSVNNVPSSSLPQTTTTNKESTTIDQTSNSTMFNQNDQNDGDDPSNENNPLRMLRTAGIGNVLRPKIRGNRSFSQPRLPTTAQTAGLARVASSRLPLENSNNIGGATFLSKTNQQHFSKSFDAVEIDDCNKSTTTTMPQPPPKPPTRRYLHRNIDSDEVRVMQKVLSNEINLTAEECAKILDSTDWDIHKAIKCIRLRQQLRSHNINVDCDWSKMLTKFNWNIRQASNYLIATQGVPEDTTEV